MSVPAHSTFDDAHAERLRARDAAAERRRRRTLQTLAIRIVSVSLPRAPR